MWLACLALQDIHPLPEVVMAKAIKDFEFPESRRMRYRWNKLLDGQIWELERGKDFKVSIEQMRKNVYNAAWSRGLRVRTSCKGNKLYIQAFHAKDKKPDKDAA